MPGGNPKALIGVGVIAGLTQVVAGVTMYLAGCYFAPWSFLVSLIVLLVCIVSGILWYRTNCLRGQMSYAQALGVGVAVSVGTGVVYAIYNFVSVTMFYPHFLDDMVRANIAALAARGRNPASFEILRGEVSLPVLAVGNLIRLSVFGTILSAGSALFLRKRAA